MSNPATIHPYGRAFYLVQSQSRPHEVEHVVDLEPNAYSEGPACSCERFTRNTHHFGRPCQHIKAVQRAIAAAPACQPVR